MSDSLYPPGYRDPEYDGTEAGFRDVVLPARIAALEEGLNERYKDQLPAGMRFRWSAEPLPGGASLMPDLGGDEPPGTFLLVREDGL